MRQKVSRRWLKMRKKETKTAGIFRFVIECMCLHISEKESLSYLKDRAFTISRAEFLQIKEGSARVNPGALESNCI